MTHLETPGARSGTPRVGRVIAGVGVAILAACLANTVIAALATAAGAPGPFAPLSPASYVPFTVVGVVAAAVGWAVVRRISARPAATFRWLVPLVLGLTFIPDVALLLTDMQPNTSVLGVAALMTMHVATTVISVATFLRIMPVAPTPQ